MGLQCAEGGPPGPPRGPPPEDLHCVLAQVQLSSAYGGESVVKLRGKEVGWGVRYPDGG
jgi:hypothetical protein